MKNRYSKYIRPLLLIIDFIIINVVLLLIFKKGNIENNYFINFYLSFFWLFSTIFLKYYKVYRYTGTYKVFSLIFKQALVFSLGFFAYFGIFKEETIINEQFKTLVVILSMISLLKILFFILIKNYRRLGKNFRKIIFLERKTSTSRIMKLFQEKKYLGYTVEGYFSNNPSNKSLYLGFESELYEYSLENSIDEIYATLSELKREEIKELTKFANQNNIQLKLIPNPNELYSRNHDVEVYEDSLKVLSIKKLPFQLSENRLIKRTFDIFFSLLVILFLMSWLIPILWLLIKLESKGPLFFKQEREGLNGKSFSCYKFRSMKDNKEANKVSATKNDKRVTKIGAFIRKTSIDELPQFFNVFLGNMSVVGPRPHMNVHSVQFEQEVTNYIKRYAVKPGITGLAQIRGYRGEIKRKSDIENRVRLDIFYIENWSFLFDVKIIFNTIFNVFKGEENAY